MPVEPGRVHLRDLISRRGDADGEALPQLTDDELVAWGATLSSEDEVPRRRAPLRATAEVIPRRRRPLVADPL